MNKKILWGLSLLNNEEKSAALKQLNNDAGSKNPESLVIHKRDFFGYIPHHYYNEPLKLFYRVIDELPIPSITSSASEEALLFANLESAESALSALKNCECGYCDFHRDLDTQTLCVFSPCSSLDSTVEKIVSALSDYPILEEDSLFSCEFCNELAMVKHDQHFPYCCSYCEQQAEEGEDE